MTPHDLIWTAGSLPDVAEVPKDSWYLVWIQNIETKQMATVTTAFPHEDKLNPLRWCTSSYLPLAGLLFDYVQGQRKKVREVAYWAKLKE